MSFVNQLPENLQQPGKKDEVINYLNLLPVRFHYKKYTLIEYIKAFGGKLLMSDVEKLGGKF